MNILTRREVKEMVNGNCRYAKLFEGIDLAPFAWAQDPFTHLSLTLRDENKGLFEIGHGFAKRNLRDKPNEILGIQIAYGRALRDLVDQMGGREKAKEILNGLRN